jgi:hypothetical protein
MKLNEVICNTPMATANVQMRTKNVYNIKIKMSCSIGIKTTIEKKDKTKKKN